MWIDGEGALVYSRTVYKKPPFYLDHMPLTFVEGKRRRAPRYGDICGTNCATTIYSQWGGGDFTNLFINNGGVAQGALTISSSAQLLAEARVVIENNRDPGIIIEEYHYDRGSLIFRCKSRFDLDGMKIQESDTVGTKRRDYYFLWPVDDP